MKPIKALIITPHSIFMSSYGLLNPFLIVSLLFLRVCLPKQRNRPKRRRTIPQAEVSNSTSGAYPNWQIDYPKVVLSKGSTSPHSALDLVFVKRDEVLLRWKGSCYGSFMGIQDDLVRVVLYNATEGVFVVKEQAFRCDNEC